MRLAMKTAAVLIAFAALGSGDVAIAESTAMKDITYLVIGTSIEPRHLPYGILGMQKGWFKEEGLNVTLQTVATGGQSLQLLLADQVNMAVTSPETLILSSQSGNTDVKMFYPLGRSNTYQLIVDDGSSIAQYCDLVGATIGFPSFSKAADAYVNTLLEQECGKSGDTVKRVETGFGVTSAEALKSGSIDAFVGFATLFATYDVAGYKFRRLPLAAWQNDYYGVGYAAKAGYIEQNPDVIEKFSRVLAKSAVYVRENPEDSVRALWAAYPHVAPPETNHQEAMKRDVAILKASMEMMRITELAPEFLWGSQDAATWQRHIDQLKDTGQLPAGFGANAQDYFTDEFTAKANDFNRDAIIAAAKRAE